MSDDYLRSEVQSTIEQIKDRYGDMADAVNHVLSHLPWWVPGWAADQLVGKWNDFNDEAVDTIDTIETNANAGGLAYSLRAASDRWTSDVTELVSQLPGVVSTGKLQSDDIFSGLTADAYRNSVVPGQRDAMAAITDQFSQAISAALNDTADAVGNYDRGYLTMAIGLAGALVLAAAAILTSELVLPAVLALAGAIVACGVAIYAALTNEDNLRDACDGILGDFHSVVANWNAFEDQRWPRAVFPA